MAFPQEFMDELLARSDIVSVISRYVSLTRRGANNVGLCPFHNEKTPSFSVSSDKQFFHCFGCGAGGDVISFVMRAENLDFPDAVKKLADWAGLSVPESSFGSEEREKKKRSLEACRAAAVHFHSRLKSGDGAGARKYLAGRGLDASTVTRFGLGFSDDAWSTMLDALTAQGFSKTELLDAGLVTTGKNGSIYDRFRNRVMFPIIDVRGTVIGFGGRIMGEGEPKYLNSPESSVYNKRKNLYALNIAKKSEAEYFILAEGYMDVIALHQAGFDSAVASLGTAFTDEQARLIAKYKGKVIISYDSDKAGVAATERAMEVLKREGLDVRVLKMTGAKDPDEFIKKFGRDKFKKLLDGALAATEYRLGSAKSRYDLEDENGRIAYLKEAVAQLAVLPSAIEREIYAGRIAQETKVSRDAILEEAARERKKLIRKQKREEERRALDPVSAIMPADRSARYKNPRSAIAEEGLLSIAATNSAVASRAAGELSADMFSSELLSRLFTLITQRFSDGLDTDMGIISQNFSPEEATHLAAVFARHLGERAEASHDYIETIKREHIKHTAINGAVDIAAAAEFYRKKKDLGNG